MDIRNILTAVSFLGWSMNGSELLDQLKSSTACQTHLAGICLHKGYSFISRVLYFILPHTHAYRNTCLPEERNYIKNVKRRLELRKTTFESWQGTRRVFISAMEVNLLRTDLFRERIPNIDYLKLLLLDEKMYTLAYNLQDSTTYQQEN